MVNFHDLLATVAFEPDITPKAGLS